MGAGGLLMLSRPAVQMKGVRKRCVGIRGGLKHFRFGILWEVLYVVG